MGVFSSIEVIWDARAEHDVQPGTRIRVMILYTDEAQRRPIDEGARVSGIEEDTILLLVLLFFFFETTHIMCGPWRSSPQVAPPSALPYPGLEEPP